LVLAMRQRRLSGGPAVWGVDNIGVISGILALPSGRVGGGLRIARFVSTRPAPRGVIGLYFKTALRHSPGARPRSSGHAPLARRRNLQWSGLIRIALRVASACAA